MESFTTHTGKCAPLYLSNIDTDQIVPKKFLLKVDRSGYDIALFHDWRFNKNGEPNTGFVLNDPAYKDATILIAGPNFGCGSSREHAPWALLEYGFRVIIAESFADIFFNNCFNTGLLPLVIGPDQVKELVSRAVSSEGLTLSVSLADLELTDGKGTVIPFDVDEFRRERLMKGLDDIEITLRHEAKIADFESNHRSFLNL